MMENSFFITSHNRVWTFVNKRERPPNSKNLPDLPHDLGLVERVDVDAVRPSSVAWHERLERVQIVAVNDQIVIKGRVATF